MRTADRAAGWAALMLTLVAVSCSEGTSPGEDEDVFRQVSVGSARVCAVAESGRGYCWGQSFDLVGSDSVPTVFGGDRGYRQLVAASGPFGTYACGLTESGTVCHGYITVNIDFGALISDAAVELEHDVPLTTLAASDTHFCGLTDAGAAWCWGDLNNGVRGTGQPETDWSLEPNLVAGGLVFTSIGAGWAHTCGNTAEGAVYCWGGGAFLGAPSAAIDSSTDTCYPIAPCAHGPVRTELAAVATQLVVGENATCVITTAPELWCWGNRFDGSAPAPAPYKVDIPSVVRSAALGQDHACALTTDGQLYCFGRNDYGQLGVTPRSAGFQVTPVLAADGMRFASVSADGSTTCALTARGVLWCWGSNELGQLGAGNRESSAVPLRVRLPEDS